MTAQEILSKLEHVKKSGSGWTGRCPGHEDRENSLSVSEKDGKVLLHCFAGCPAEQICSALGIETKDLFNTEGAERKIQRTQSKKEKPRTVVAEYIYTDEHGHRVAKKVRYEPKFFSWMRFESGEWKSGLGKTRPGLYRWLDVKDSPWVLLLEGEKDADTAGKLGFPGCSSGGTGTWTREHSKLVAGKDVIILADADGPGRAHARKVARGIWEERAKGPKAFNTEDTENGDTEDAEKSIKIVEIPGSKDLTEAVEAGMPAAVIQSLLEEAPTWEPKPGADVLEDIHHFIRRFVALTENQAVVASLWVAHTHAFASAEATAYLSINSAEKQSGKTRLLRVFQMLVKDPWLTGRVSSAVIVRKVDAEQPTLLLDEVDAAFASGDDYAEALRGILNTGAEEGGAASACVGQGANISYKDFSTYCPKALAGIGTLPDTVMDRSVIIRLKRAERRSLEPFRKRAVRPVAQKLAAEIGAWTATLMDRLRTVWPNMPEDMSDRHADLCEHMVAIADAAGGSWPERARKAFVEICRTAENYDDSLPVKMLGDIRDIMDGKHEDQMSLAGSDKMERIQSAELLKELLQIETSPWDTLMKGRPITASKVARLLKPFEIAPGNVKFDGVVKKGYHRAQFEDAWARYLPKAEEKAGAVSRQSAAETEEESDSMVEAEN